MSRVIRKPAVCICENKDADQLHGYHAFVFATWTVQSLYFLNPKYQASSHLLRLHVQPGLCQTWSETLKTGFLTTRLIYMQDNLRQKFDMPYFLKTIYQTCREKTCFFGVSDQGPRLKNFFSCSPQLSMNF